jgi:hypothetical protein
MLGSYGDGGASNDLVVATSGGAPAQTVYYFDYTDQTWYYTSSQAMVRMNFDQSAGITQVQETMFSVVPNPANDAILITTKDGASGDIIISSLAGQVVYTGKLNGVSSSIPTSTLTAGIYLVSVNQGAAQKLVIQH